jgi:hypothetical protein
VRLLAVLASSECGLRDVYSQMHHNPSLSVGRTLWGALVEAASSGPNIDHLLLKGIDGHKAEATGDPRSPVLPPGPSQQPLGRAQPVAAGGTPPKTPAAAAATVSAADLALLQSLTAKLKELTEAESAKAPVPMPRAAEATHVDSTQTVRALTPMELADGQASRWFAIELMLSADPIDAAEVPNLDIFEAYRLYSVIAPEQGRLEHALRLGFFSTEVAAESVARYLTAYFPTPTIRRVSIAEHERFADRLVAARKDIGAAGKHAVIELTAAPAPPPLAHNPTSPVADRKPPRRLAALLWSRPSKPHRGTDR